MLKRVNVVSLLLFAFGILLMVFTFLFSSVDDFFHQLFSPNPLGVEMNFGYLFGALFAALGLMMAIFLGRVEGLEE